MDDYLLICRSVTHAQRVLRILQSGGVAGQMVKAPLALSDHGCTTSVRIGEASLLQAKRLLQQNRALPYRIYGRRGRQYTEVPL